MKKLVGEGKPFHSAVDKTAALLKRKVGTGAEFMKELMGVSGVKPTELQERGLTEILGMPKMTHDQFMAALTTKPAPAVRELTFSDKPEPLSKEELRREANNVIRERASEYADEGSDTSGEYRRLAADEMRRLRSNHMGQALRIAQENHLENFTSPHHQTWTLPGGENYREMLIKSPEESGEIFGGRPGHFGGEPGILASMRVKDRLVPDLEGPHNVTIIGEGGVSNKKFNTREEANAFADVKHQGGYKTKLTPLNNKKYLHLEELQSDWHQQGREHGYKQNLTELPQGYTVRKNTTPQGSTDHTILDESGNVFASGLSVESATRNAIENLNAGKRVPDAPFKKNWEEMALKRLIHHAAEKGYHGVVVTPGKEQADRYSLAKYIDSIMLVPNPHPNANSRPYYYKAFNKQGDRVADDTVDEQLLSQHIGKEAAEKLLSQEPNPMGERMISGANLVTGDEGMKGFYDKKVPNILNSIGKKYGVKTELGGHKLLGDPSERGDASERLGLAGVQLADMTSAQTRAFNAKLDEANAKQLHYFPITEDMRKDVLANGLPLYNKGGTVHMAEGGDMDQMKLAVLDKKLGNKTAETKPKYEETDNPQRILFKTENTGGVKGIVVPKHMWEGKKYKGEDGKQVEGMKQINVARAKVYGSENRAPLHVGQIGRLHKQVLNDHFQRPLSEQLDIEKSALQRLRDAKHIHPTADTLDASEKLDTVRHEYDTQGRSHVGFASKGVAGHSLYTSGHGANETRHALNTCAGQTTGCGGGTDEKGVVDTSKGTCFAPNAESQYVNAAVRRACHEQAKHDPAMTKDWILSHTNSLRNKAKNADKSNQRLLFRPNVVDETDVSSRHVIRHLNKQRSAEGKPPIIANSYGKTNELHDPANGYHVTYSNVGPKTKQGASIEENIARDKNRVRQTILAEDASGKPIQNEDKQNTPPKNSYMVTDVKRGSPMSKKMEEHITHAKYWSTGRPVNELNASEKAEGEEGHFGGNGKPTTPDKAHFGHITYNNKRFDYQKQHILHPRLVQVGHNDDGTPHMIPTDSRFKDEEFLPKTRFKSKNGKNAGAILMTTPTESTSNLGHQTSFTHHVNDSHIDHAKINKGEYQIDSPQEQEATSGKEYSAPQPIKILRKAEGGSVSGESGDDQGLGDDDFYAFPESNFASQHHLALRHENANLQAPVRKIKFGTDFEQFKTNRLMRKAQGGTIDVKNIGVKEAPNMDVKAFISPRPAMKNSLPVGGIFQQPPQQPMQGMPPPQGMPPQGMPQGMPQGAPPQGMPPQPPSNILQMTPQGQAMSAIKPPQMARGGKVDRDMMMLHVMNRKMKVKHG